MRFEISGKVTERGFRWGENCKDEAEARRGVPKVRCGPEKQNIGEKQGEVPIRSQAFEEKTTFPTLSLSLFVMLSHRVCLTRDNGKLRESKPRKFTDKAYELIS